MSKEMNWDKFVPTREIREYDKKLRESVRQREQLKQELAELEKKPRDIFWDVEYAMFSAGQNTSIPAPNTGFTRWRVST